MNSIKPLDFNNLYYPITTNKNFIVVHTESGVGIVLKSAITAIRKFDDCTVINLQGDSFCVEDKYEDIKQYLA